MTMGLAQNQSQPEVTVNTVTMGHLVKSVAGGTDVTLTEAEAENAIIQLAGALTANINVIVPNQSKTYVIYNNTSGAFTLTIKTTGAVKTLVITQGNKRFVYCDGADRIEAAAPETT